MWAIEYPQKKVTKVNKERTRVFSEIFPRCQYKQEFDPKSRSKVKSIILESKVYTITEVEQIQVSVVDVIRKNTPICSIYIVIPLKQNEVVQGNLPESMHEIVISEEPIKNKLPITSKFKSPGRDKIKNFWMKQLSSLHVYHAQSFRHLINNEEQAPEWLTEETTHLLPKTENQTNLINTAQ